MYRKMIGALAVFLVVSTPTLLADPIYNFDPHAHSVIFSSTISITTHPDHDSPLSEESFFFTSVGREDQSLDADSLADKSNSGLHLGWQEDVEHNHHHDHHHHHYSGGPTSGNIDLPADTVIEPEPSTPVSILSGLAIILLLNSRKRASA